MTDVLKEQYQALTTEGAQNLDLLFYPPEDFPGGFFFYVCPVQMLENLVVDHGILPGQILAFGPASHVGLAFETGIGDYLKDPWDLAELVARIDRRWGNDEFHFSWGTMVCDGYRTSINGIKLNHPPGFHRLVRLLAMNAGKALSRKNLLMVLGHRNPGSRLVDLYVSWLRKEIKVIIGHADGIISSQYGKGYQLSR